MLRLLGHFLQALASVSLRRLLGRPLRSSWSYGFEVFVEGLRRHTRWFAALPVPAQRAAADAMTGPLASGVKTRKETRAGVPVTWFETGEPTDRVILYAHGGGHVFGSAAQDGAIASRLARTSNARVVAPDYRLAPEAPCPADVEDVLAVYRTLLDEPRCRPFAIAGLSSGGGTALSALVRLRDAGGAMPSRAVLLSPMVDATGASPSWSANAGVDWALPEAGLRWARLYAGPKELADPEVSPVNAALHDLPPMLVIAGGAELLRDDAVRLAEKARAAGSGVELYIEPGMVHSFMSFGREDEASVRTFGRIRKFLA